MANLVSVYAAVCIGLLVGSFRASTSGGVRSGKEMRKQAYRPQFYFIPAQNWMNDPNGTVFLQGQIPPLLSIQSVWH
jgi:hypothetical protein